jgi:hypothetical protein
VNQLTSLFFLHVCLLVCLQGSTHSFIPPFLFLIMAPVKFLHILTVVSLAILHASFDALSVNALIVDRGHVGRDFSHVHAEIAKKRGASSTKCRSRPTSASQSPAATTTNPSYAPSSNASEPAHTTSSSQPASTNAPASSIDSKVMYGWSNNEQPSLGNFATGSTRLCVHSLIVSGFSPLTSSAQSLQLEIVNIFRC